jgi:hypothetical protein
MCECVRAQHNASRLHALSLALSLLHRDPCSSQHLNTRNALFHTTTLLLADADTVEEEFNTYKKALEAAREMCCTGGGEGGGGRMTVLVMDGRLQDAAERLGMAMCGEGLKVAALRLCEALLFQEPRCATPTGALVRDVCSMIARCTAAVAERGARMLTRLLQQNSSWAQLSVRPS